MSCKFLPRSICRTLSNEGVRLFCTEEGRFANVFGQNGNTLLQHKKNF